MRRRERTTILKKDDGMRSSWMPGQITEDNGLLIMHDDEMRRAEFTQFFLAKSEIVNRFFFAEKTKTTNEETNIPIGSCSTALNKEEKTGLWEMTHKKRAIIMEES